MTKIAILDPFSGISGDMMLGALLDVGLDQEWLRALPSTLGLEGIGVRVERVTRGEIASWKVDFDIPPQPHGRHLKALTAIVNASPAPADVKTRAIAAFEAIATIEASIHATTVEKVHLHEVGAVDAILDVVGSIWGLYVLGVEATYCGVIALGDGFVDAAHGRLAVPAPATLRLLEGMAVRAGPENSGELTTPTGAALAKVLSRGVPPPVFQPLRSGYGAGAKNPEGRSNTLWIILAEIDTVESGVETLAVLSSDIDDMTGELLAATADALRGAGALDVTLLPTLMKKGRPGVRIEVLCRLDDADHLEHVLFHESRTIGVRRATVSRRALPRRTRTIDVFGHPVTLKAVSLPGGGERAKAEYEDVRRVAAATGRSAAEVIDDISRQEGLLGSPSP